MKYPKYCPCNDEKPEACPACGATVEGDDKVNGVCQALYMQPSPEAYGLRLVLLDKRTGEEI